MSSSVGIEKIVVGTLDISLLVTVRLTRFCKGETWLGNSRNLKIWQVQRNKQIFKQNIIKSK